MHGATQSLAGSAGCSEALSGRIDYALYICHHLPYALKVAQVYIAQTFYLFEVFHLLRQLLQALWVGLHLQRMLLQILLHVVERLLQLLCHGFDGFLHLYGWRDLHAYAYLQEVEVTL